MAGGNTVTSSAFSVPSGCGTAAEPMKLPGLMSAMSALLTATTFTSSVSFTITSGPLRGFRVSMLPSIFSIVARIRMGGVAGWARTVPLARETPAARASSVCFFIWAVHCCVCGSPSGPVPPCNKRWKAAPICTGASKYSVRVRTTPAVRRRSTAAPGRNRPAASSERSCQHDPAAVEHDGAVAEAEDVLGVLLDDHDGEAELGAQPRQRVLQFVHDHGGQPLPRLVEQQESRVGHQGAADRQHLLLAAGQLVAHVAAALRRRGNRP